MLLIRGQFNLLVTVENTELKNFLLREKVGKKKKKKKRNVILNTVFGLKRRQIKTIHN